MADQVSANRPGEPIAIVGVACRLPGAPDIDGFATLLRERRDAITEVPPERWDIDEVYDPDLLTPGTMSTRRGGFIKDADQFDAGFFGISSTQARTMDPQHRLLLEVAWEAVENAGLAPETIAGSATGVFVGVSQNDYAMDLSADRERINAHYALGNTLCIAANRVSNFLGALGPSMAIDTGCSSSLVSTHLACQSLRTRECALALAGGVHLVLSPISTTGASHAWLMAPDGRCKSFDARADGYVRGEGCGLVVLKRLADARADGDRIWGVIRGTAVNHNPASQNISHPNAAAQARVIRRALADAGLAPDAIDYIEAHGVGTALADAAEGRALMSVFADARTRPLRVSAVKTNIGHLEPAAGVASLIKALLCLRDQTIAAQLHFETLNPDTGMDEGVIEVVTAPVPWPPTDRPRRVGVNAFGLGGSNAHVVVEEAPTPAGDAERPDIESPTIERPYHLLVLSARTSRALRAAAERYRAFFDHCTDELADACFSAATGRAKFAHRLALWAADKRAMCANIDQWLDGGEPSDAVVDESANERRLIVAVGGAFQPRDSLAAVRMLWRSSSVARAALETCDRLLRGHLPRPLLAVVTATTDATTGATTDAAVSDDPDTGIMRRAVHAALEVAVIELWRSWGLIRSVEPVVIAQAGERPELAAWATGALELDQALSRLVHQDDPDPAIACAPTLAECEPSERDIVIALVASDAAGPAVSLSLMAPSAASEPIWAQLVRLAGQLFVHGRDLDWNGFDRGYGRTRCVVPGYPFQRRRHWFEDSTDRRSDTSAAPAAPATRERGWFARRLAETSARRRREVLGELVAAEVTAVMTSDPDDPEGGAALRPDQGLFEAGMTSLTAIELTERLRGQMDARLPSTLVFDHATISGIAEYLAREHLQELFADVESDSPPVVSGTVASRAASRAAGVADSEPIAIVGMGCRFPGGPAGDVSDPEAFWQLLISGGDAITEVDAERWRAELVYHPDPDAAGKTYSCRGGFLRRQTLTDFDAEFFAISPREAVAMDPQHRLLLEVTWQALDNAGQPPRGLAGSATGVFVGIMTSEYHELQVRRSARERIDGHYGTGIIRSAAAGRLSYALGLRGPCVSLDSACSSSLVAVHMAVSSLRRGECTMALAGGVSAVLTPDGVVYLARARALAADGRCKAFDAAADGYIRSEGCGVVVLRPLRDALANGDHIHALILGSAVNHDGASSGFTVPSGPSQQALVRTALDDARTSPESVGYVEAHGTGTALGDPIEVGALGAVFGPRADRDTPVYLGSVKTNIGHSESAAGIAGLIKAAQVVERGEIPPIVHLNQPNPRIPWADYCFALPTEVTPWPTDGRPRIAGVSSFGLSGTNAHVVLAAAPASTASADRGAELVADDRARLLPLSAHNLAALRERASSFCAWLDHGPGAQFRLADIAFTASQRRSHHEHRIAVVATDQRDACAKLAAYTAGEDRPGLVRGTGAIRAGKTRRVVFVFPGQGSQWPTMGRQLLASQPVFRAILEACERAMAPYVSGWSLIDVLSDDARVDDLARIEIIQPVLFALEVALAELWRSLGVHPDVVVGHSMGEVAAAYIAGLLSLDEAARIICRRSALLRRVSGLGAMAVVEMSCDQAHELAARHRQLAVAVENGPRSTVLSGDAGAIDALLAELDAQGVFCRRIKVDVASHSPMVDELGQDILAALADVGAGARARLDSSPPMVSTVTRERYQASTGDVLDAEYWRRNLRDPVRFAPVVADLVEDGHDIFIEISPHPILVPAIRASLDAHVDVHADVHAVGRHALAIGSLQRDHAEWSSLMESMGALYTAGLSIDWSALNADDARLVPLPDYPFQRKTYWPDGLDADLASGVRGTRAAGQLDHAVLGHHHHSPQTPNIHTWEQQVTVAAFPYLADHRVGGAVVFPGMGYVALALSAAELMFGPGDRVLSDVEFRQAMFVPEDSGRVVQVVLASTDDARRARCTIFSRATTDRDWLLHARMCVAVEQLAPEPGSDQDHRDDPWRPPVSGNRSLHALAPATFYDTLAQLGNQFGPRHRGIERLQHGPGVAEGLVVAPPPVRTADSYVIHPAFLDACVQVGLAALDSDSFTPGQLGLPGSFMPRRVARLTVRGRPPTRLVSYARSRSSDRADMTVDVHITAEGSAAAVIEVCGIEGQYLDRDPTTAISSNIDDWLYELGWQRIELCATDPDGDDESERASAGLAQEPAQESSTGAGTWLILADHNGVGQALADRLGRSRCVLIHPGDHYHGSSDGRAFTVDPADPAHFHRAIKAIRSAPECAVFDRIIHLWSLDIPGWDELDRSALDRVQDLSLASVAHLVQAVSGVVPAPLWLVTRGAHSPVGPTSVELAVGQAPIWGLGRVIAQEHPELWGGLVDLDPAAAAAHGAGPDTGETVSARRARALLDHLDQAQPGEEVAIRGDARYLAQLIRKPRIAAEQPLIWRRDGAYLVTGGLGGIGAEVAVWMAEQGARRLILMSRTGVPARAQWPALDADSAAAQRVRVIQRIESLGASVHVAPVDVADEPAMRAYFDRYHREQRPPIRGLIHAAASVSECSLLKLDRATIAADLAAKVHGTWLLDDLLGDQLDFAVLFSSASVFFSSPFLGSYAAANAFLDACAHHRRARGRAALSVNWGFWAQVGLAARRARDLGSELAPRGMGDFTPDQGIAAMQRLLECDAVQATVMPINWRTWSDHHSAAASAPLLVGMTAASVAEPNAAPTEHASALDVADALAEITEDWRRREFLETFVREQIGRVLRLAPGDIGREKPLGTLGIDSLMALEVRRNLELRTGLTLPATLIWTYPTVFELANFLLELLLRPSPDTRSPEDDLATGQPATVSTSTSMSEDEAAAMLADVLSALDDEVPP